MHPGDCEAQARYTYKNIKDILSSKGFGIRDVVKWTIFLRDISAQYETFNKIRDEFFRENNVGRKEMAASTCVEAKLCREDLTVEIEAVAVREEGFLSRFLGAFRKNQ